MDSCAHMVVTMLVAELGYEAPCSQPINEFCRVNFGEIYSPSNSLVKLSQKKRSTAHCFMVSVLLWTLKYTISESFASVLKRHEYENVFPLEFHFHAKQFIFVLK